MNQYYDPIMQLKCVDEFKNLVRRWHRLSENMNSHPSNMPVIHPDIHLYAKSGASRTKILQLLSGYLYTLGNLMDFYGDVIYFEFLLAYYSLNEHFKELQRSTNEIDNAADFQSEYRGKAKEETLIKHAREYPIIMEIADIDEYEMFKNYPTVKLYMKKQLRTASVFNVKVFCDLVAGGKKNAPFSKSEEIMANEYGAMNRKKWQMRNYRRV